MKKAYISKFSMRNRERQENSVGAAGNGQPVQSANQQRSFGDKLHNQGFTGQRFGLLSPCQPNKGSFATTTPGKTTTSFAVPSSGKKQTGGQQSLQNIKN